MTEIGSSFVLTDGKVIGTFEVVEEPESLSETSFHDLVVEKLDLAEDSSDTEHSDEEEDSSAEEQSDFESESNFSDSDQDSEEE